MQNLLQKLLIFSIKIIDGTYSFSIKDTILTLSAANLILESISLLMKDKKDSFMIKNTISLEEREFYLKFIIILKIYLTLNVSPLNSCEL